MTNSDSGNERGFGEEKRILKWLTFGCNILILLIGVGFLGMVVLAENAKSLGAVYLMLNLVIYIYLVAICGMIGRVLTKIENKF